jgi:4-aminobutyrate aminotransferase-like enzyme
MMNKMIFFRPEHYLKYPVIFRTAEGCFIEDDRGNRYLDFFAAMGTVSCGHNNQSINNEIIRQVNTIWASSFFPTERQIEAISKINSVLPDGLEVVTLYSTGAEAIEQAIRLARASTGKFNVISFKDHYHGKSQGTMYLTRSYPECYGPVPESYRTVIDDDGSGDIADIETMLEAADENNDVAAVIFEPVVGYSGPRRLNSGFISILRKFCDDHGIIMIADEILTGFNRCRGWFVSCLDDMKPDILVFGKGVGNGYPISGVACSGTVAENLKFALPGSTFAGNSLACAAACGVIDYMKNHNLNEAASRLENIFSTFFSGTDFYDRGIRFDGMGGLLRIGFEDSSFNRMTDIYIDILKNGVITSHTNYNLRISPPLTISENEFIRGLEIIRKCILNFLEQKDSG